jgi:hypothetical protein
LFSGFPFFFFLFSYFQKRASSLTTENIWKRKLLKTFGIKTQIGKEKQRRTQINRIKISLQKAFVVNKQR